MRSTYKQLFQHLKAFTGNFVQRDLEVCELS
uniref:Uncharacterized protein n=1 Tax=Anguilla anguilla TaxID=7936 RepID=A0A0E9T965_ANGAN